MSYTDFLQESILTTHSVNNAFNDLNYLSVTYEGFSDPSTTVSRPMLVQRLRRLTLCAYNEQAAYSLATEAGVLDAIWSVIKAIFDTVINLFKKFFAFIGKLFSSSSSGDSSTSSEKKKTEDREKKKAALEEAVKKNTAVLKDIIKKAEEAGSASFTKESILHAMPATITDKNGGVQLWFEDIVKETESIASDNTGVIHGLSKSAGEIFKQTTAALENLKKIATQAGDANVQPGTLTNQIDTALVTAMEADGYKNWFKSSFGTELKQSNDAHVGEFSKSYIFKQKVFTVKVVFDKKEIVGTNGKLDTLGEKTITMVSDPDFKHRVEPVPIWGVPNDAFLKIHKACDGFAKMEGFVKTWSEDVKKLQAEFEKTYTQMKATGKGKTSTGTNIFGKASGRLNTVVTTYAKRSTGFYTIALLVFGKYASHLAEVRAFAVAASDELDKKLKSTDAIVKDFHAKMASDEPFVL